MPESVEYIVRNLKESDLDEVRELRIELDLWATKYDNEVMMKVDSKGIFVAQDIKTGMKIEINNLC